MHLLRMPRLAAALAVVVALALATTAPAAAETGPMSAETDHARIDALGLEHDLLAAVRLTCRGHVGDDGPAVGCEWKQQRDAANVRVWQVWNVQVRPDAGVRNLVAEVGPDVGSIRDTSVVAPAKYLYAVVGLDHAGEVVARSRVVAVRLGEARRHDIEQLRLDCLGELTDAGPVIGCDWSAADEARVAEYRLFRATHGHDRRLVAATGPDQTSYRDDAVEVGVRHRYWVVGIDDHGNVVAASRSSVAGVEPQRPEQSEPRRDTDEAARDEAAFDGVAPKPVREETASVDDEDARPDPKRQSDPEDRDEGDRPTDRRDDRRRGR